LHFVNGESLGNLTCILLTIIASSLYVYADNSWPCIKMALALGSRFAPFPPEKNMDVREVSQAQYRNTLMSSAFQGSRSGSWDPILAPAKNILTPVEAPRGSGKRKTENQNPKARTQKLKSQKAKNRQDNPITGCRQWVAA
jgi:hypothetical protein